MGVRQHEVVQQVPQRNPLDRHAQRVHVREIRLTALARHVLLTESNLLGRAFLRLPLLCAPLKRAQLTVLKLAGMATLEILEKRSGLQSRVDLQLLDDLAPYILEWILASSPCMRLLEFAGQTTCAPVLAGSLLADARLPGRGGERRFRAQKTKEFADDVVSQSTQAAKGWLKTVSPPTKMHPNAMPLNRYF